MNKIQKVAVPVPEIDYEAIVKEKLPKFKCKMVSSIEDLRKEIE